MKIKFLAVLLLAGLAFGQDKKPEAAPPKVASTEAINKILKAEHIHDTAVATMLQAENQFQQLKVVYAQAQATEQDSAKQVSAAIEAAWLDSKLSKDEYTFDPANFTFAQKPKTPEKK